MSREGAVSGGRPVLEDLTVVIPTLGREILERSLETLAEGSHWPARVVVVDQGCKRAVETWLDALAARGLRTTYVPSQERGRALGVNRGVERVETRFVAITDDDCFVAPDWAANMVAALRAHPGCIVTGRVDAAGDEPVGMVVDAAEAYRRTRPSLKFDPLSGGNMGAAVSLMREIGPLEEDRRILYAEDGEWAYRALRAGASLCYEPDVAVAHHGWRDLDARVEQYRGYARSQGAFYGKYVRRGDAFMALRASLHQLRALVGWLRGRLAGDDERARISRAYALGLLPGMISMFRAPPGGR